MDALECIMTRRSIRKYLSRPVGEETVLKIIKAGAAAPSAGNQQPWQFIILKDKTLMEQIAQVHPYAKMLPGADFAVLTCMSHEGRYPPLAVDDCGAATQNMLLAAHALGLGGVWIGIHHEADLVGYLKELLNIPENYTPFSMIALGYTEEQGRNAERFKPEMMHFNGW